MDTKELDLRDVIMDKMNREGRTLAWLAKEMEINYNTLYSVLIHKTISLSDHNKGKINEVLGTDY